MTAVYSFLDRVIFGFVTKVPGWLTGLVAGVLYGGCGLALPLALHWRVLALVEVNAVSTVFAAAICLAWVIVQVDAADRRHLVQWTTSLRNLDAAEFEWLVGELFRREGWKVKETGGQGVPDGNIDLELTRDRERRVVQCKRWAAQLVGVDVVRSFAGTLMREQLSGAAGIFVTLSGFTEQARAEAALTKMELIDGRQLYSLVEKARRSEPCPRCGQPMRFDYSRLGWWFRCIGPGCDGKRDLSGDPGRAIGLLAKGP